MGQPFLLVTVKEIEDQNDWVTDPKASTQQTVNGYRTQSTGFVTACPTVFWIQSLHTPQSLGAVPVVYLPFP